VSERAGSGDALRVVCIADTSADAAVAQDTLVTILPRSHVEIADTALVRSVPVADCIVIDSVVNGETGVDVLRRLRAMGYDGAAVLLVDRLTPELSDEAARLGSPRLVRRDAIVEELADAVAMAARMNTQPAHILRALRRTQQLIAAGEIAVRLQHALNNPLAALLAEAQLLEMEPLGPDHAESVARIVEHTRRVIEVVRGLDGIGATRDTPPRLDAQERL
jgi:DNA-binding NarL/FixJ family response regulator